MLKCWKSACRNVYIIYIYIYIYIYKFIWKFDEPQYAVRDLCIKIFAHGNNSLFRTNLPPNSVRYYAMREIFIFFNLRSRLPYNLHNLHTLSQFPSHVTYDSRWLPFSFGARLISEKQRGAGSFAWLPFFSRRLNVSPRWLSFPLLHFIISDIVAATKYLSEMYHRRRRWFLSSDAFPR